MESENIPERRNISNPQPRVEQTLMRMAVESLNPKQREIWFLHNNERLTQDEIAAKMKLKRTTIQDHLLRIETKLTKYLQLNKGAYVLLKLEHKIMNEETE